MYITGLLFFYPLSIPEFWLFVLDGNLYIEALTTKSLIPFTFPLECHYAKQLQMFMIYISDVCGVASLTFVGQQQYPDMYYSTNHRPASWEIVLIPTGLLIIYSIPLCQDTSGLRHCARQNICIGIVCKLEQILEFQGKYLGEYLRVMVLLKRVFSVKVRKLKYDNIEIYRIRKKLPLMGGFEPSSCFFFVPPLET